MRMHSYELKSAEVNIPRRAVQLKITIHMHSPIKFSQAGGVTKLGKHKSQKMLITEEFSVMFIGLKLLNQSIEFRF